MAIDTREKRQSALSLGNLPLPTSPTPDVAKDAAWRQQAGWGYSGIAAAPPVPPTGRRQDRHLKITRMIGSHP